MKATILVVDDSATDRRLVGGLLEKQADWKAIYAADGLQALTQIEMQHPDVVVTDLIMPRMNGRELVQAVRRRFPEVPVILITAKGSEQIAVKALQYGAASYVSKKALAQKLPRTVEKVLAAVREGRTQTRLMSLMTRSESKFILENDPDMVAALCSHLKQTMHCVRLADESDRIRMGIAVQEALLNALYHGNLEIGPNMHEMEYAELDRLVRERRERPPYCHRRIHVFVKLSTDEATYVIRDEGPGFDPSRLPDPRDPKNLGQPGGRGILLMRTFMDEVRYNEKGNEVTLTKRLRSKASAA